MKTVVVTDYTNYVFSTVRDDVINDYVPHMCFLFTVLLNLFTIEYCKNVLTSSV